MFFFKQKTAYELRISDWSSDVCSSDLDLDFTREVLADVLRANDRKITIDEIQRRVAEHFRIKPADMVSARRAREVARPRQVAMYLAKRLTPRSLPEIGRRRSEEHTSELQSLMRISYAVFCLKKKT